MRLFQVARAIQRHTSDYLFYGEHLRVMERYRRTLSMGRISPVTSRPKKNLSCSYENIIDGTISSSMFVPNLHQNIST
ncbi:MAG: hypothetical protein JST36_08225 [Bacteroidetes bacterium]|nr:hypothetical protein [Bacteroidota bacterium]